MLICACSTATLNRAANFSGIGCTAAPGEHGDRARAGQQRVIFRRRPGRQTEVEARVENISITNRSTTLAKGNVENPQVEHVLAALVGLGVDNAVIELDATSRRSRTGARGISRRSSRRPG